jgi:uncharacterized membrane protein YhaH (DUF805 family)
MNFDFNRLYFTTDGRIGRGEYWIGLLILAAIVIVVSLIVAAILGPLSFAAKLIIFIVELIVAYPCYALFAKRFQDRGRPGNYAAIPVGIYILIALLTLLGLTGDAQLNALGVILAVIDLAVGIWILIDLGILRGTVGPNEFGPDPVAVAM